ncbi:MAG: urease accessory protein UreE [Leptolyngbyaceae cyanobacterium]
MLTLVLTAEERTKARHYFEARFMQPEQVGLEDHASLTQGVYLRLPRGTVLQDGDRLTTETQDAVLAIAAQAEPVMTVTASSPLALLKAAYHLGNRHVSLEVQETWLRFSPDPVLKQMLEQMGLTVTRDEVPFSPELGAYISTRSHPHHH